MSIGQSSSFTGLNMTETFSNRLQPSEIKASSTGGNALDLIYNYTDPVSGKNAGHVYGITNNLDTTRSQTFTYDQLNRITSAQTISTYATSPTHCWGETYQFDGVTNGAWGNLTQIAANSAYTGCSQESGFSCAVDANNHMVGCYGDQYDTSGNMTNDGTYNYYWNGESQLVYTSGGAHYSYDGAGRRVTKTGGNEPKLYWYGSGGEILSETNPSAYLITDHIYFAGKRVATVPNDLNLNGGFEQGLQGWSASGAGTAQAITNAANAHSGSSYAYISTPANYTNTTLTTTQPISAQKGETITATGWVYHETGSGYTRWWLSVQGTNGGFTVHPPDNFTLNTWIYQTLSITIPSSLQGPYTATVYAKVESYSTTEGVSARFDDVTLNGYTLLFAEDSLGTTRVVTDTSGVVCYDADFYPYGGERPYTNSCSTVYKFEGKERDTENGNDDFGARYYSNRFGRWLSADWSAVPAPIPYANLANPQTLNLYSMVTDDPESFVDLNGHELTVAPELLVWVTELRSQSPSFDAELKAHEGPNNPNLTIQTGKTPNDVDGSPSTGNTATIITGGPVNVCSPDCVSEDRPYHYNAAVVTVNDSVKAIKIRRKTFLDTKLGTLMMQGQTPINTIRIIARPKQQGGGHRAAQPIATTNVLRSSEQTNSEIR
jgi:RHS repeat-associated protein